MIVIFVSGCSYSLPEKETSAAISVVREEEAEELLSEYAKVIERAEYYSDILSLSKASIRDKLISRDGFTEEEADFAVENIDADWNENALKKAEQYSRILYMTPAEIRQQLVSSYGEMFTAQQADYAIKNLDIS